jgi:hypothetical protein
MDVTGMVVFLASSAASLIMGETNLIEGGWTAHVGEYSSLITTVRAGTSVMVPMERLKSTLPLAVLRVKSARGYT